MDKVLLALEIFQKGYLLLKELLEELGSSEKEARELALKSIEEHDQSFEKWYEKIKGNIK